jgi:thiosulfate/3-mercaptopyruvate sulfurtransferase
VLAHPYTTIISTEDLAKYYLEPDWVIVDCRFDLAQSSLGLYNYQQGHIRGAIYAHLANELSGPVRPDSGRHPLPSHHHWIETLSYWGIDHSKQVVAYDSQGGAMAAARLWWMLRWMGHTRVAVLDGGYPKWLRENRPIRAGIETPISGHFASIRHDEMIATTADVEHAIASDSDGLYRLFDARAPERYSGENEAIDPVAGHIPGATNAFYAACLDDDGVFLEKYKLHEHYAQLLSGLPPERAIFYCGSGVTSCQSLLAMEHAGLSGARLYAGSWSEWIRNPEHEVLRERSATEQTQ